MKSFRVAQSIYDVTVCFCDRYIDRRSRTHDQMVANGALSLPNLCCHLLDRQLAAQATAFETESGFAGRLYRVRRQGRNAR